MDRRRAILTTSLLLMALAFLSAGPATMPRDAHAQRLAREEAVVVTDSGEHRFTVEIADNEETRARGLMFRKKLGEREGMLFFYDREQQIAMWMRNTYIPLDMIFIHADGRVQRIEENTEPFSEEVIPSGEPVLSVLEVKAGTAAAIGLKPGDRVKHSRFKNATGR